MLESFKAIVFGIVEGITEWLPVSSTGHMILLDKFIKLDVSEAFWEFFLVVIQLGAIMAVVVIYWSKIFPFSIRDDKKGKKLLIKKDIFTLWWKILFACIPAAIIGIAFDDIINRLFYNYYTVAISLIFFGVAFIIVEKNDVKKGRIESINDISYKDAFIIGLFQLIAAIFPGTSRSGATILGGIYIGLSRKVAAEFTFFMAVPVMFGASLLKLIKYNGKIATNEIFILIIGMIVSFITSIIIIKALMNYIKKHSFIIFGYYRIILGVIVLLYFSFF